VAVTCQLTERGFSTKNRDKVNDDRLGIKLSLQMKLVNMKFTMKILICIFCIMDLMANIYLLMFYL
jgi:hypothetical protein